MSGRACSVLVVGGGRMGAEHVAACLRAPDLVSGVAVVDPDPAVRDRWSARHVPTFAHLELAVPAAYDLTIVAAPTAAHLEVLCTLAPHDTRVLVEKPCAVDRAGFERLEELAGRARARLVVGLWRRCSLPFQALRDLVQRGALGTPRLVLACQWDAAPPRLARAAPAMTGGIGLDCGVHETDTARWLGLGSSGSLRIHVPGSFPGWVPAGDSDQLVATGVTDRDVLLSVALTRTAGGTDEIRWRVVGTEGSAEVELGTAGIVRRFQPGGRVIQEVFPGDPIAAALDRQLAAALGHDDDTFCARLADVRAAAAPWIRE